MESEAVLDRHVLFLAQILKPGKKIDLLAGLTLFEQTGALLHGPGLYAYIPVEFKNPAESIDDPLLNHPLGGQPFRKS